MATVENSDIYVVNNNKTIDFTAAQAAKETLSPNQMTLVAVHSAMAAAQDSKQSKKAKKTSASSHPVLVDEKLVKQSLMKLMAQLMEHLQVLQEDLLKVQENTAKDNQDISSLDLQLAKNQYQKAINALKQYEAELEKQKHESFWQKLVGIVLAVVSVVISVFMGPEMFVLTVAMTAFTMSGGMSKLTADIAKGLEKLGISSKMADVLADITMILMVVVISMGVGAAGSAAEAAASDGAEATESSDDEIASQALKMAAEAAGDTVEEDTQNLIVRAFKGISKRIGAMSKGTKLAIMEGLNTASSVNFAVNLVNLIPMSKAEKKKVDEIVGIIAEILSLIAVFLVGSNLNSETEGASNSASNEASNAAKRLLKAMKAFVDKTFKILKNQSTIMGMMFGTEALGQAGALALNIEMAKIYKRLAAITETQGQSQAMINLYKSLLEMVNETQGETTKSNNKNLQQVRNDIQSVERMVNQENSVTQVLMS